MDNKKVSVIMPAYNAEKFLDASIASVRNQNYQNWELWVVDDGSADDIRGVLSEYTGKYANIRAIYKENGGVTSARLRGVAEATGDWIGFMDGDDYVEPWMYARLLEIAREYKDKIGFIHFRNTTLIPGGFRVNYGLALLYGILGSAAGTFGDLCFSVIKRQTGIKDYGNLIPGHGGILDRFDSMMVVGPLAEALLILIPLVVK